MTKKLTMVEEKALELNNDLHEVERQLKNLRSRKCILKKKKGLKNYESQMTTILQDIQLLVEVKALLNPREKFVTEYEQEDVDKLDYEETLRAKKTIQSKKFHTRWITDVEGDNDEFRNACRIEQMLLEHEKKVKPFDNEMYVRKSDLTTIIDTIESSGELSQERILELLKSLL